ncbi:MAG: hypothetical protein JSR45_16250 [Proteobacteria bacterium]|nr:hypothetical protein [Pseudomonadota bacterium]
MNRSMKTVTLIAAGAAVLALASCNKKNDGAAPASTPAAAQPGSPEAPTLRRKAGLWRMAISNGQAVVQTIEMCIDAETDQRLSIMGTQMGDDACSQHSYARQPDGSWTFSSVCDMGTGGRTSSTGTASGDFSTHYVVHADSVTEGAALPQMNGKHSSTIDSTWTGACPAGQVGGDMTVHGMKINVLKAMKAR